MAHTGSTVVTQESTFPSMTANGRVDYQKLEVSVTGSSTIFKSGSSIFGDDTNDKQMMTGSLDVTGSYKLNGYEINEISNDTSLTDGSATSLPTENAVKSFIDAEVGDVQTYLRKQFVKSSASITNATTASFTAVTASAPSGYTATGENDFVFFINGQYMEHNALAIQQKGSSLELHVHTGSIGYILESDDEILSIGKFNS